MMQAVPLPAAAALLDNKERKQDTDSICLI